MTGHGVVRRRVGAQGRDAVLKACDILPDDERTGRAAGVASGTADVVDATVIVTAVRHQAPIATGDPGALTRVADSIGVKIRLFTT
jgi:hypothetical protein